jgi:hypothetical protein
MFQNIHGTGFQEYPDGFLGIFMVEIFRDIPSICFTVNIFKKIPGIFSGMSTVL